MEYAIHLLTFLQYGVFDAYFPSIFCLTENKHVKCHITEIHGLLYVNLF